MRVVKDAEDRKNEILDVAQELFSVNGFDATSTNDILERVKIARGTLYYHFKSKEDILDSLIDRITNEAMEKSRSIASEKSIPLLDRLSLSIMALNIDTDIGHEVITQVHKPQNALMHQKMQQKLISGIVPIITELLVEGIEAGIFNTEYPEQAVEMAMLYSNIAFDDLQEMTPDLFQKKVSAFIYNTERLLGCEKGVMQQAILRIIMKEKGDGTI